MNGLLDKIIARTKAELEIKKLQVSLSSLKAMCELGPAPKDLYESLSQHAKPVIIAECKKRSPTKGELCPSYDPVSLAKAYERGKAAAISVLTNEPYFGGNLSDLARVNEQCRLALLRKDFIVDEYQIYEGRRYGADSFLLLAGVLDIAELQYFIEIGRELGMEPLVESHSPSDLNLALQTDAKLIGINNRNLQTMKVDLSYGLELLHSIDAHEKATRFFVCESGVRSANDITRAHQAGFQAFLIGETLVTASDPEKALLALQSNP